MSEPARHAAPSENDGSRAASGTLRDWLAAMRAQTQAPGPETATATATAEAARPARAEPGWSPRIVETPAPAPQAEDADVSDLMAENLMLQAKLKLEAEWQDGLKALLAQEVRSLREHVRQEMEALQSFRAERERILAEREALKAECARIGAERDRLRGERDAAVAETEALRGERDELREDHDLWRARAEALAQPLFQTRR